MLGIIIAIVVGTVVGGLLPKIAVKFSILGDVFLNSLMMIVIPLVVLSMIVGITGLGDIRNLGAIGRRTLIYYIMTTGIAVLIGIILVNIIRPGKGISTGETHSGFAYTVGGDNNRTVTLTGDDTWEKRARYNEKYILVLLDQDAQGAIESISQNSVQVGLWESRERRDLFYVTAEDGTF
mgnify:CR=1 FL=1